MPLPVYPPALVQVPARAGVRLCFPERRADPSWPVDWWQRNYDTLDEELLDVPPAFPFTERHRRIPEPPL